MLRGSKYYPPRCVDSITRALWGVNSPKLTPGLDQTIVQGPARAPPPCSECHLLEAIRLFHALPSLVRGTLQTPHCPPGTPIEGTSRACWLSTREPNHTSCCSATLSTPGARDPRVLRRGQRSRGRDARRQRLTLASDGQRWAGASAQTSGPPCRQIVRPGFTWKEAQETRQSDTMLWPGVTANNRTTGGARGLLTPGAAGRSLTRTNVASSFAQQTFVGRPRVPGTKQHWVHGSSDQPCPVVAIGSHQPRT